MGHELGARIRPSTISTHSNFLNQKCSNLVANLTVLSVLFGCNYVVRQTFSCHRGQAVLGDFAVAKSHRFVMARRSLMVGETLPLPALFA
jgi:hypothetical protein